MASVNTFPDFAVVCSFLERYGEHLQLPEVSIIDLETAIGYAHCVPPLLKDIIIKLMRKTRKSFCLEKWQRYLAKMCRERFSEVAAWEVERFGFAASKPQIKIAVLRFLCESQFDDNFKFKAIVNDEDPDKMRVEPMGRDKMGLVYWFQKDEDTNIRIYREEQDDPDSSTWEVISSDREQMENLITALKSGTNVVAGQGKDEDTESSSSDSSSDKAEEKTGQAKNKQDSASSEMSKETSEKDKQENVKESGDKTEDIEDGEGDNHLEVKAGKRTIDEDKDVGHEKDEQREKVEVKTDNEDLEEEKDGAKEEQSAGPTDAVNPKMADETGTVCKEKEDDIRTHVKQETVDDEKEDPKEVGKTSPKVESKEKSETVDGDSEDGIIETKKEDPKTESSKEKDDDNSSSKDGGGQNKDRDDQADSEEGSQDDTKTDLKVTKDVDIETMKSDGKEPTIQDEEAGDEEKEDDQSDVDEEEEDNEPLAQLKKTQKKRKKKRAKSRFTPRRNASRKAAVKIEEEMKEEVEEEEEEEEEEDNGPVGEDDSPCCKCGQYNHPEWILLCDKCDSGYHTACLRPPLMVIPDGNWYCPNCEHDKLVVRLLETLAEVDTSLKKKERKRKRKHGDGLWALTDICMRNILPGEMVKVKKQRHGVALRHTSGFRRKKQSTPRDTLRSRHRQRHQRSSRSHRDRSRDRERHWRQSLRDRNFINDNEDEDNEGEEFEMVQRRSQRTKKEISYKFEDFDTAINSAIQEEVVEHKKAVKEYQAVNPINRGKDISTIEGMKESSEDETKEEKTRRKIKRRLGDLDATSEEEEEEGSEDFKADSDAASDKDYEEEEGDEEVEDDSYVSEESDSDGPRRRNSKRYSKWNSLPKRRSERRQKRVRYRDFSEDEEFESESDQYSEYSDDSHMKSRRRKPASRRRDHSNDDDESEDSSYQSDQSGSTKRKPKNKRRVESDSESSENTGYVRKRKFRLESDNEDEENNEGTEKTIEKDNSSSEEEQESGPVVRKKLAPVARIKRIKYLEDSDYSPSDTEKKLSRCSSKRIDYRKIAAESDSDEEDDDDGDEEADGEEEEEEEEDANKSGEDSEKEKDSRTETSNASSETEKDSNKENGETEKPSPRDTKAKESVKKADDYANKSAVSPPVSNGTTLNGGGTIVNGNGTSGNGEGMTTGEDEDEDLLGVTDLVEFVTQDV